ncbi:serine/threonine-protein kinase HAL4/sat4 [Tulasnella sp. 425]|nr:serine/threonine-protein kinase HAL4/sat4 [Tulasnella sp. 425]
MAPSATKTTTAAAATPSTTADDSTPTGEKPKEPGIPSSTTASTTTLATATTNQSMASTVVNPSNKPTARKASAPFPSPVPTDWANNADLGKVRANTPLSAAHPRSPVNGSTNGVPVAPPPPPQTLVAHPVEPIPRPARSKSDASIKSLTGKASAFKRMFGGGGGTKDLPSAFEGTPVPTGLEAPFSKISLTPVGGSSSPYVNGARTPASERNDPFAGHSKSEFRERAGTAASTAAVNPAGVQQQGNQAAAAPPRSPASKDNATPTVNQIPATPTDGRKTPTRPSSTDGRFTLNQLLGSGPRLSRKSSASSRRSDSSTGGEQVLVHGGYTSGAESAGGGKARTKSRGPSSVGGESTASLSQKYGFCDKAPLGKGATSVVRLAHKWDRKEEKLYAVKEFRKRRKNETEKEYIKKLTAEFCISSTLHHPNVVETVDLVQDEHQAWCEVMEYCPGGDLYAAIKRGGMSASEVECSFKQILLGVEYLHSQGVAHRDIKPENLFFDAKGQLKIGDYGASTVYRLPWETSVHMSTGLCGSEPYIAPEQFNNKPYDARLVDIWACGIVYYCLHFQELPWRVAQLTDNLFAAYVASTQSKNPAEAACPPTIDNLSPRECRPLLRRMLEPRPEKRILIEEIMKDNWVKSIEPVKFTAEGAVLISHTDLVSRPQSLQASIEAAFGSDPACLGLIVVTDLPTVYPARRERLLRLAERFSALPEATKEKYVDASSKYCFGWSHGKEIMNGKPDTLKGSYYANPIVDVPQVSEELKQQFAEYYSPNIWPAADEQGVEDFEAAFKDLGRFIFRVGCQLAAACQSFASQHLADRSTTLESLISTSQTTKARLLHYFPPEKPASADASDDSWCGTHLDNSMLTGLCSALYLKKEGPDDLPVEVPAPSVDAGLYIHTRGGEVKKVSIPKNALAFQTGEALELCTAGRLRATPHLVKAGSWTPAAASVSRETFALFMQPDASQVLTADDTFGTFSKRIFSKHYDNASM